MKREIPVVRPARGRSRRRYDFESTCPPKRESSLQVGNRIRLLATACSVERSQWSRVDARTRRCLLVLSSRPHPRWTLFLNPPQNPHQNPHQRATHPCPRVPPPHFGVVSSWHTHDSARSPLFRLAFLRVMGNGSRLCSSACDSAPLFCSPTSQATSTPPLPFFSPTRHTQ